MCIRDSPKTPSVELQNVIDYKIKFEMAKHTREELLYLAKLAEQCERYDGKSTTQHFKYS